MLIHFQFNGFKTLSIVIKQELEIYTGILTASILTFISFLSFCVNGEGGGGIRSKPPLIPSLQSPYWIPGSVPGSTQGLTPISHIILLTPCVLLLDPPMDNPL